MWDEGARVNNPAVSAPGKIPFILGNFVQKFIQNVKEIHTFLFVIIH